jgi:magnesium-transporting ATPase (P-type)
MAAVNCVPAHRSETIRRLNHKNVSHKNSQGQRKLPIWCAMRRPTKPPSGWKFSARTRSRQEKQHGWLWRLWVAVRNPLVILLTVLAIFSLFATAKPEDKDDSNLYTGSVMLVMVVLGVSLRLIQETKADNAAAKLKAMIKVTATVIRDGQPKEIPLKELVPGDVVKLSAGDMIPGDVRLMSAKDLFIIQATLTGESLPVEKSDARDPRRTSSRSSTPTFAFSARAWKAARPRRSSSPPARRRISAKWPAASPASRWRRRLTRA